MKEKICYFNCSFLRVFLLKTNEKNFLNSQNSNFLFFPFYFALDNKEVCQKAEQFTPPSKQKRA